VITARDFNNVKFQRMRLPLVFSIGTTSYRLRI